MIRLRLCRPAILMVLLLLFSGVSRAAAPSFQAAGTLSAGTGARTVAWPTTGVFPAVANYAVDDVALLIVQTANQTATLSTPAGFVEIANYGTGTAGSTVATRVTVFWARATSTSMTSPVVADSGNNQVARIVTFRGVIGAGNPWDVTSGGVLASVSSSFSIPGATTTVPNTLVVAIAANGIDTTNAQTSGWTNADLGSLTERADANSGSGNGGGFGVATGTKATAGTYAVTTGTLATASVQGLMSIALKPNTTTLGDGANPGNVTVAPSGAITDLDAFTFVTSKGSDSVTGLTVTLTGTNAFDGLSEVRITDSAGTTTYFTAVTNPTSNTITFSGGTAIPVTATIATFKVRITPKTHANMPVPPGSSYGIGGTVTAFTITSTYEKSGSDGASATVTVDNLSPAGATVPIGTVGNAQVTLNWTTSASTDFSRSVMLRWTGSSAGTDVPAEGADYVNGNTIGTATVVCVRTADAASTTVSGVDGAGTGGCSSTALTNGQAYAYKIFQKDANGNYDTGVSMGTFTPAAPVVTVASFNAFETSTAANATSGRIYTKLAGTAFGLDVVAITGSSSQATSFNGNVKVELLANTGTAGSGYGVDNCPTSNSVIQTIASTAIAGGRSTVNFSAVTVAYRDVRVRISYPTTSPTTTTCSTDSFAIRPGAITLTTTPAMATPPSASSAATIKAGASFTLTATTTTAATDAYGGTLTQDASLSTAQITSQDTSAVSGGVVGTLSPATLTANASPSNNASYSEVGYLYLAARAYRDASYTAVDQSGDCVANSASVTLAGGQYGCDVGNVAGVSLGRFIPDHFAISSSTLTAVCTSSTAFTYFGEDGFTTAFTLTAQNAANGTTQNYSGVFAKLNLTTYTNYGFTAATLPAGSSLSSSATAPSGSWVNGVAAVSAKHQISRPTAITGETSITVSAAPTDGEVPAAGTPASLGSATLRYGRLQLLNAYGSELLALPVTLRAQYWNGSAWVTNADDSCTTIAAPISGAGLTFYPEVAAGVQGNHLSAAETTATVNVSGRLASGGAGLTFSRSGAGNSGYVDISIPLAARPWLQFPWTGAGNVDPSGRATFGIYKSRLIYSRENY